MAKTNWLDETIGFFSPLAGLKRLQARNAMDAVRKYDAASAGRRTGGWRSAGAGSANAEIAGSLEVVRDRVRDLVRNNPYASRAVSILESNIVGTGIIPGIKGPNKRAQVNLQAIWNGWADSVDCDVSGLNNFYGLQALAMRTCVESGEALLLRRWRKMSDGYDISVPMQIQVLEGDYIDSTKNMNLSNGGYIVNGVEFNARNQRVAYWLWSQHPGESFLLSQQRGLISERHLAKDVKHIFRVDRSGQIRGMSWGAPCVIRLMDYDGYEDAQLVRQRIAACFAGFVRDLESPVDAAAAKIQMPSKIEAGAIEILPAGKSIEFPNIPSVSNDGHSERVLRGIAMGWGVPYEDMTGDLSNVNFSSMRGGRLEFHRNLSKWQWNMFIPRFNVPAFNWFLEAADIALGANISGIEARWTPPRKELVDPTKEVPAIVNAIRGGIQTLPEAIREQGGDFEAHLNEVKESNDLLDKLGITLDSDPRRVQKSGGLQLDQVNFAAGGGAATSDTTNTVE